MEEILESEFEVELFKAATYNLNQKENKLRYNNFAYSIRELSRHFLYRLAPEENVKHCSWFKEETEDGKPTRTQRIKYAIQGGISDNMLNLLGFDSNNLNEEIRAIKKTIDSLSKYTHINPETFDIDSKDVDEMSAKVLGDFKIFAERISVCK